MRKAASILRVFPAGAAAVLVAALYAQSTVDTKDWTAQQDHQNMMDQLGIKALRPGPSGNEKDANHANYDEATANPYPNLPDVLTLKNGKKVKTAAVWWNQRRPEIVEDFDREVLGRVPKNVPRVTWEVTKTAEAQVASHAVLGKQLIGHVDNSSDPDIKVDIQMTLVVPADAKGPVPVMMMFGGRTIPEIAFPAPYFPAAVARRAPGAGRGSSGECRRSADRATDRRWMGHGYHRAEQHPGRQRRWLDQRNYRSGEQGPAAQAR